MRGTDISLRQSHRSVWTSRTGGLSDEGATGVPHRKFRAILTEGDESLKKDSCGKDPQAISRPVVPLVD